MSRHRNWCFTSFHVEGWELRLGRAFDTCDGATYLVIGLERCGRTHKDHLQGYVEFSSGVTLSRLKALLQDPAVHCERRLGSSVQASSYCRKDGLFREWGVVSEPGHRSDFDLVRQAVARGDSLAVLCSGASSYQSMRSAELLYRYKPQPVRDPPVVKWFHGPTGTGKTRHAVELCGDSYWMSSGSLRWWDGYDGHKNVILDDLRSCDVSFSMLLRLLDRYVVRVEVKGAHRFLEATLIIVTSIHSPQTIYSSLADGEDVQQLVRRVSLTKDYGPPLAPWVAGH